MRRTTLLIGLALVIALLAGCSASRDSSEPSVVTAMTPSEKRSAVAVDFPAEVPAPAGIYSDVVSQGGSAWDYHVEVDARAIDVMRWYLESYLARSWQAVDQGRFEDQTGSGAFATLRKGSAETHVKVYGEAQTRPARAIVSVGVGASVLETQ